jgi:hypothetical protein
MQKEAYVHGLELLGWSVGAPAWGDIPEGIRLKIDQKVNESVKPNP